MRIKSIPLVFLLLFGCVVTAQVQPFNVTNYDEKGLYVQTFEDIRPDSKIVPSEVGGAFGTTISFNPESAQSIPEYVSNKFRAHLVLSKIPVSSQENDRPKITGKIERFEATIGEWQWTWSASVVLSMSYNGDTQRVIGRATKTNWQQMKSGVQALDLAINDALSKIDYSLFDKS